MKSQEKSVSHEKGENHDKLKKVKSFLGFDISQENELVADDKTDPFPEGDNAVVTTHKRKKDIKDEEKSDGSRRFSLLVKRPSNLPEAPNFVEHLDSLLDSGKVATVKDNGKPKMW